MHFVVLPAAPLSGARRWQKSMQLLQHYSKLAFSRLSSMLKHRCGRTTVQAVRSCSRGRPVHFAQFRLVAVRERSGSCGDEFFELLNLGSLIQNGRRAGPRAWLFCLQTQPNRTAPTQHSLQHSLQQLCGCCRARATPAPAVEQYSARAPKHQKVTPPPNRAAPAKSLAHQPCGRCWTTASARQHSCARL